MEELLAKHRKEQKDLQGRITQKKKQATKKTRKGVNSECEEMERKLKEQQEQELATLNGDDVPALDDVPDLDSDTPEADEVPQVPTPDVVNEISEKLQSTAVTEVEDGAGGPGKKRNRQKERLARRAAEQEQTAKEAEKEAAKFPNWKRMERTSMLQAFKENGLVEEEIQPDGHCLFSSIADQLSCAGIPLSSGSSDDAEIQAGQKYKVVRKAAARYIEGHPDEFAAFMEEPIDQYVYKIRDTAEWGGHLELQALAKNYNVEICVLQDGTMNKFGPSSEDGKDVEKIWLAYYRHGYGLGEHYNSLRKAP